ncbi:MAG TPA: hypothetical protein VGF14_00835 [Alphaproteobacteria bacterium]
MRLFLCLLFLFSLSSQARAGIGDFIDGCPKELPSAQIRIIIEMFDPPVYQNYTIPELTGFKSTPSPYPSDAITHTYGLTKNPLRFLVESQIASSTNMLNKKKCYWYSGIALRIQVKPEIYMGKEIQPRTCYYNAVLRHELEHANIERRLLQDYKSIITDTVTDFVRKTGFIRNIEPGRDQDVYNHLKDALGRQIDTIHAHMEPVRAARQAEIDTMASYESTAAPCRQMEKAPY